jgi:hypothetical protein
MSFTFHAIARSHTRVSLTGIRWSTDTAMDIRLPMDTMITFDHAIRIPADAPYTQPYWLSRPHAGSDMFTIPNDSLLGLPETPNDLNATVALKLEGEDFTVQVPLSFKKLDPVKGDVVEQLRIVPDATVAFSTSLLITHTDGSVDADIRLHAFKEIKGADLEISSKTQVGIFKGIDLAAGTDTVIPLHISAAAVNAQGDGDFYLSAQFTAGGQVYDLTQHLIQYNHIPTLQYFTPPFAKVLRASWKCTAKHIGYIEGAGDYIPTFLRLAGLEVDVLKESDFLNAAKLKKYDAVITGIRAANVEKRMSYWLPVLFQYVQEGGTLVMQYNTLQDLATTKLGPYPFSLSTLRVTEEDANVTFVDAKARLLNVPNQVTDKDFMGWVQERGLYFAVKWDEQYKPLFEMHDSGEQPLMGSTIYAKYGKGNYIYTTLSFSRQLPAGNKGAVRLLMNMLSAGKDVKGK